MPVLEKGGMHQPAVGAAESCDLLIFSAVRSVNKQDQEIAAFGSSYRGVVFFRKPETQKPAFAGFCEIQGRNLEFELVPRRRLELPRP
ncbi:hypothetical protein [Pseudomonas sp. TH10]|uniref:hypothetical protein n=1 Tax=Pseudomonas sp. TH10 TaxID=2796376 RepID=UPI001914A22C|nr:hypothetical protein [Pseudomonas sp. TH10]MBK5516505.1 hypothetical protein [Pseudomonas sp. TH10]